VRMEKGEESDPGDRGPGRERGKTTTERGITSVQQPSPRRRVEHPLLRPPPPPGTLPPNTAAPQLSHTRHSTPPRPTPGRPSFDPPLHYPRAALLPYSIIFLYSKCPYCYVCQWPDERGSPGPIMSAKFYAPLALF
jgi:hypothetical protein